MKTNALKSILIVLLSLFTLSAHADMLMGLYTGYSSFDDKQTDQYGFGPVGLGYGLELGVRQGPLRASLAYTTGTYEDNINHNSVDGTFTVKKSSYEFLLDTLVTSRFFFGVGYGFWNRKVSLSGDFTDTQKSGAFSTYNQASELSDSGVLLRLGIKFLRTKTYSFNFIVQRNLYSDDVKEDQAILGFRYFFTFPKLGSGAF